MKRNLLLVLFLLVLTGLNAQSLFVGSYNIRMKNAGDSIEGNGWTSRYPVICDMINFESPDIFGSQEVLAQPLKDMLSCLKDYSYIGVGRDDGKLAGEFSPVFYKKSKFKPLDSGTFWLSKTPQKAGSVGWDAALPRICSWGHFKTVKTNFEFWYFNLHMDHIGVVARRESAKLVVATIKRMCKGAPVILTGDFNVDQNDEIYTIFSNSGVLKDCYVSAKHRFATNGTFNSFKTYIKTESRIDHIFVSPAFLVGRYGILTNSYWTPTGEESSSVKGKDAPKEIQFQKYIERTPSDHYPVMAHIEYQSKK